jgi:phosphatidylserine/phosphatidylglycerophosphate/cardiolipin synthase-like enzyme
MPKRRPRRTSANNRITTLLGLLILLALFAYQQFSGSIPGLDGTEPTPVRSAVTLEAGDRWYTLYFTDPTRGTSAGGPDEPLAQAIGQATQSVDMAAYSLSLESIKNALLDAHRRGVRVRLVMESDNLDNKVPLSLRDAGIDILGDRREGLMHNKFVIIDGKEVWTGSMNFTTSGTYKDNNHIIRFRSEEITHNYSVEFDEMFVADQFGSGSPANTPYPVIAIENVQAEVYFSPDDGVSSRLEQLLRGAQKSIYFLAYSFTSDPLAQAILERSQAGVSIHGVFDQGQYRSNTGGEYDAFRSAGLDVRLDGNPGQMHHKVMIIDEQIVVLGSYNFSASAEKRNDENLMVVTSPEIAARFLEEFHQIYALAQP